MQMRRGESKDAGSENAWGKSIRDKRKDAEEANCFARKKVICVWGKVFRITRAWKNIRLDFFFFPGSRDFFL